VGELLLHLGIAILAVTFLVMLAMDGVVVVVFFSVPLTFALTLFSYYMLDYTLNRITLFALVFVVVVDDSIIIAENMHRHFKMKRLPFKQAAIYAINEVGNPTILATFCNCSNFTDGVCIRNDGPLYESDAHWCFDCHDIILSL
jgi:multidrug efflux pump subunit AcrB